MMRIPVLERWYLYTEMACQSHFNQIVDILVDWFVDSWIELIYLFSTLLKNIDMYMHYV